MGNLCPCTKSEDEPRNDYRPIPNTEHQAEQKVNRPTSAQYYQSVLDDARNKFINTSATRRPEAVDSEKVRTRLDNVSIDTKKYEVAGGNQAVGCTDATSQNIIENLSRPVSVYNIDIVADEMAEIIAKHTTELNIDDSASSIASFKAAPSVSTA